MRPCSHGRWLICIQFNWICAWISQRSEPRGPGGVGITSTESPVLPKRQYLLHHAWQKHCPVIWLVLHILLLDAEGKGEGASLSIDPESPNRAAELVIASSRNVNAGIVFSRHVLQRCSLEAWETWMWKDDLNIFNLQSSKIIELQVSLNVGGRAWVISSLSLMGSSTSLRFEKKCRTLSTSWESNSNLLPNSSISFLDRFFAGRVLAMGLKL